jgi:hypothetical protein
MELRIPKRCTPLLSWLDRTGQIRVGTGDSERVELWDETQLSIWQLYESVPAALANSNGDGFVIARNLTRRERELLEEHDVAYADAAGHLFVRDGPVVLRIDDPTLRTQTSSHVEGGLGHGGVRVAQELFADPDASWTVSMVEERACISKGRASQVLQFLDREKMTEKRGQGRGGHRVLRDRAALLDWIVGHRKALTTRPRLECAIYANDGLDAARRVGRRLARGRVGFSLTGSIAARLSGVQVLTTSSTWLRIDPQVPLSHAYQVAEATPVRSGGNVVLVHDVGRLGTVAGDYPRGTEPLARELRVYLDLLSEPRGESAAELYRNIVLGND